MYEREKEKTTACPRMSVRQNQQIGRQRWSTATEIPHGDPELRDVLMGFLDSASSLCDIMNTTMAAVLNEIMSIQADEACGAEYDARTEARVNSRNGLCTHASLDLTYLPHCLLAFALDR